MRWFFIMLLSLQYCLWRYCSTLTPPPDGSLHKQKCRGGRVRPLSMVRCPLSVDQIGISVKSCPLMAESWNVSAETYWPLAVLLFYSVESRGGRKVRLIDLPIPIRSSDCIRRYNRLMPSSDFWIGRLCRFILSSAIFESADCVGSIWVPIL